MRQRILVDAEDEARRMLAVEYGRVPMAIVINDGRRTMEIKLRDGVYAYTPGDRDEDRRRMGLAVYGCTASILAGAALLFVVAWRWGDAIMEAIR